MGRNSSLLQLDIVVFPFSAWDHDSHLATMGSGDRSKYLAKTLRRAEEKDRGDPGPQ